MNLFHFLRRSASAVTLLFTLTACQTTQVTQEFPTPGRNWRTSIGQLQYTSPQRSVVGEAVVSTLGARDFQLEYTAGPGVPLMRLSEIDSTARAEGLFARGSWQGDPARASRPVATWLALREALVAVNATGRRAAIAQSPAGVETPWTAKASSGEPRRVIVQFPRTGERFVFVFTR